MHRSAAAAVHGQSSARECATWCLSPERAMTAMAALTWQYSSSSVPHGEGMTCSSAIILSAALKAAHLAERPPPEHSTQSDSRTQL
jgi:hypothetical protein